MNTIIVLDTGPLGMATHPKSEASRGIEEWLADLLEAGIDVCIPEIADYELRREYLRRNNQTSIKRLDELEDELQFNPINTSIIRKAAEYWSKARSMGKPTADDKALDGDMILVAHASSLAADATKVIVATTNVGHLVHFSDARLWSDITPAAILP